MNFVLQGSLEAQIDNDLKAISDGLRAWGIKMGRLMKKGYSLKRAAYIVDGSPLGAVTRKRVNLWLIRRRNADRALVVKLKAISASRLNTSQERS